MKGGAPQVDSSTAAGKGGFQPRPFGAGASQDGFQGLPDGGIKVHGGTSDVAGRTGSLLTQRS